MKKLTLALAAAAGLAFTATPAAAQAPGWNSSHSYGQQVRHDRYDRYDRYERGSRYDRRDNRRVYDSQGRYYEPRRVSRNDRVWRGNDGRYYCKRDNGTTGLIIGAAGGALVGRAIDTRGERATGTILGAVIGGLLGREIDRGDAYCR